MPNAVAELRPTPAELKPTLTELNPIKAELKPTRAELSPHFPFFHFCGAMTPTRFAVATRAQDRLSKSRTSRSQPFLFGITPAKDLPGPIPTPVTQTPPAPAAAHTAPLAPSAPPSKETPVAATLADSDVTMNTVSSYNTTASTSGNNNTSTEQGGSATDDDKPNSEYGDEHHNITIEADTEPHLRHRDKYA